MRGSNDKFLQQPLPVDIVILPKTGLWDFLSFLLPNLLSNFPSAPNPVSGGLGLSSESQPLVTSFPWGVYLITRQRCLLAFILWHLAL